MSGAAAPPPSSRGRGFVRGALRAERPLRTRGAAGPATGERRAGEGCSAGSLLQRTCALVGALLEVSCLKGAGRSAGQRQPFTPALGVPWPPGLAAAGGQRDRPRCRPFVAPVKEPFERGAGPRSL